MQTREKIFENVVNWRVIPIFGNLFQGFNEQKGFLIPYQDYDQFETQCNELCSNLKDSRVKPCMEYCANYKKSMENSIQFASLQCPDANPDCCRRIAGDNEFAYHYCTQKGTNHDLYASNQEIQNMWIVLITMMSFLILLSFVLLKIST